jgi:hypothetical protein
MLSPKSWRCVCSKAGEKGEEGQKEKPAESSIESPVNQPGFVAGWASGACRRRFVLEGVQRDSFHQH